MVTKTPKSCSMTNTKKPKENINPAGTILNHILYIINVTGEFFIPSENSLS